MVIDKICFLKVVSKYMLTQKDFDEIEEIIDKKLEEKIKFLPTKDEFYGKMDELMGELKTIPTLISKGGSANSP